MREFLNQILQMEIQMLKSLNPFRKMKGGKEENGIQGSGEEGRTEDKG